MPIVHERIIKNNGAQIRRGGTSHSAGRQFGRQLGRQADRQAGTHPSLLFNGSNYD